MKEFILVCIVFFIAAIIYSTSYENSYIPLPQQTPDTLYRESKALLDKQSKNENMELGIAKLKQAAQLNHAQAMHELGLLYETGKYVIQDKEKAIQLQGNASQWFKHSAATKQYGLLIQETLPGKALAYLEVAEALGEHVNSHLVTQLRQEVQKFDLIYKIEKETLLERFKTELQKTTSN